MAVFVYIGLQPNTAFLNGRIKLGAGDGIPTDAMDAHGTDRDLRGRDGAVRIAMPGRQFRR